MGVFVNSARKLYLISGDTDTLVPTVSCEPKNTTKVDNFFDTGNVDENGTAYENGVATAQMQVISVETRLFKDTGTTPALLTCLSTIRACKDASSDAAELTFGVVEPDGTGQKAVYIVKDVQPTSGKTEDGGGLKFDLHRKSIPSSFTPSSSTPS